MQKVNVCRRHANQALNDARQKYGREFARQVMVNVISFEDGCWYCKNQVPFEDDEED